VRGVDGYAPETLTAVAKMCVEWNVKSIRIESDFGQGHVREPPPAVPRQGVGGRERGQASGRQGQDRRRGGPGARPQKELRIIESLSPPSMSHRLVVNLSVIEEDWRSVQA
jgi:hypothetical protein